MPADPSSDSEDTGSIFVTFTDEFGSLYQQVSLSKSLVQEDDHANLWSFLGLCQEYGVDLVPVSWQAGRDEVGAGGQGLVYESLQHLSLSFAYKRWKASKVFLQMQQVHTAYSQRQLLQELKALYRALKSELHALAQPRVKKCPYIVKIEGVSWEMLLPELFVPVHVYERAPLGSLREYLISPEGARLLLATRLKLCRDIVLGIYCLHMDGIIHGDISPDNVLIHQDYVREGVYVPRIIDFGYSTIIKDPKDRVFLPQKDPWTAPEVHHRGMQAQEAMKADIFSLALLLFWILFSKDLSERDVVKDSTNPIHETFPHSMTPLSSYELTLRSIRAAKASGDFKQLIDSVMEKTPGIPGTLRRKLRGFFHKNLDFSVQTRAESMEALLQDLEVDISEETWLMDTSATIESAYSSYGHDISLADTSISRTPSAVHHIFFSLEQLVLYPEARLHRSILEQCASIYTDIKCGKCARGIAMTMATAYALGFGAPKSPKEASFWARRQSIPSEDVAAGISALKSRVTPKEYASREIFYNTLMGQINCPESRTAGELEVNIEALERELEDIGSVLGRHHYVSFEMRRHIILMARNQLTVSGPILDRLERLSEGLFEPSSKHELAMTWQKLAAAKTEDDRFMMPFVMFRLAYSEEELGNRRFALKVSLMAEKIFCQIHGKIHPARLSWLGQLSNFYEESPFHIRLARRERISREELRLAEGYYGRFHLESLRYATNLAHVLRLRCRYKEAEQQIERAYKVAKKVLGSESIAALNHVVLYADVLLQQDKYDEAELVVTEFLRAATTSEKIDARSHHRARMILGICYYKQGRLNESLVLIETAVIALFGSVEAIPLTWDLFRVFCKLLSVHAKLGHLETVTSMLPTFQAFLGVGMGEGVAKIAQAMLDVGIVLKDAGVDDGTGLLEGCLIHCAQFLGVSNRYTLHCMDELADIYCGEKRWQCAEQLIRASLVCSRRLFKEHWHLEASTARRLFDLAYTLGKQDRNQEALAVMKIWRSAVKPFHTHSGANVDRLTYIAPLYEKLGDLKRAASSLKRALVQRLSQILESRQDGHENEEEPLEDMVALTFINLCGNNDKRASKLLAVSKDRFLSLSKSEQLHCLRRVMRRIYKMEIRNTPASARKFLLDIGEAYRTIQGRMEVDTLHFLQRIALIFEKNGNFVESSRVFEHILSDLEDANLGAPERLDKEFTFSSLLARQLIQLEHHDKARLMDEQARKAEGLLAAYEHHQENLGDEVEEEEEAGSEATESITSDESDATEDDTGDEQEDESPQLPSPMTRRELRLAWHCANVGELDTAARLLPKLGCQSCTAQRSQVSVSISVGVAQDAAKVAFHDTSRPDRDLVFRFNGFEKIWKEQVAEELRYDLKRYLSDFRGLCRLMKLKFNAGAKKLLGRTMGVPDPKRRVASRYYRRGISRVRTRTGRPFMKKMYDDRDDMKYAVARFNRLSLDSWRRIPWQGTWPRKAAS